MRHTKFIGRVGPLALALGVGIAVVTSPGVARAEPTGGNKTTAASTDGNASSRDAGQSRSVDKTSNPSRVGKRSDVDTRDTTEPSASNQERDDHNSRDGSTDARDSRDDIGGQREGTDESERSTEDSPGVGAAGVDADSQKDVAATGNPPPAPESKRDRSDRDSLSSNRTTDWRRTAAAETDEGAVDSSAQSDTAGPVETDTGANSDVVVGQPLPLKPSVSARQPADSEMAKPAATRRAPSELQVSTTLSGPAIPLPSDDPSGDQPAGPAESPLLLAMLAWSRRQSQSTATGEQVNAPALVIENSLAIESATRDSAPTISGPASVGTPDAATGVVTGSLNVTDPEGGSLIFTVTGTPKGGAVEVNASGAYAYTPSVITRLLAGATASADFDSFSISASDGLTSTIVSVTVPVLPATLGGNVNTTIGSGPSGIAVSPDGTRLYIANQGSGTLSVINTANNSVVATVKVVSKPSAVATDTAGTRVYVAGNRAVTVIDATTNTVVTTVGVGYSPSALALSADGTRLYVANRGSGSISVIDTATNQRIDANRSIFSRDITVGFWPSALALSADGSRLYVANNGSGSISVVDTATNQRIDANRSIFSRDIKVGSRPSSAAVSPDGGHIYVTNHGSKSVSLINTVTNTVVATLAVGTQPWSIVVSPDDKVAYIAHSDDKITILDTTTHTLATIGNIDPTPEYSPPSIALSPDGKTIYVIDQADGVLRTLYVVRGNTAPTATGAPTLGTPDATTGAITGTLNFTDPDGDRLQYHVTGSPTRGTVTLNATTGSFTYTPNAAARELAVQAITVNGYTDTFTVRVSDPLISRTVTVTVPVLATGEVISTPYLPFDMAVTETPQKVFAHYVPWMPISIDNLPSEVDYYSIHLMDPAGENGIHASYGGYMRDRPLPRNPMDDPDWRYHDALTDVTQAKSVGIDGFTVDITMPSTQNEAINNLLRAAQATPGFSIQPQADLASDVLARMTPAQFASTFAPYLSSDGAFHLSDGRVVLSAFYAERQTTSWWNSALNTLRTNYDLDVAFVPTFLHPHLYMTEFAPISYGFGNWGGRNTSTVNPDNTGPNSQVDVVRTAHELGKIWMQPIAFQDNRPRAGIFEEPYNSQTNANGWEIATNEGAEWVQLVTWNDYAEGTAMAPSAQHGWTMLDMQAYSIAQFKYGSAPTVVRDALYISHRSQMADAESTYDESKPMQIRPGTPAPVDNVEIVVFTTAPATVWATIGGVTSSCAAGAGRSVCNFALRPGEVVVSLERDGVIEALIQSPFSVTDAPDIQDMDYHMTGGLR